MLFFMCGQCLTSYLFFSFFPFYRFFPLSLTWPRAGQAAPSGAEPTRLSRFYRPCCLHFGLESDCSNPELRKTGFESLQNYLFWYLALGKQWNCLQTMKAPHSSLWYHHVMYLNQTQPTALIRNQLEYLKYQLFSELKWHSNSSILSAKCQVACCTNTKHNFLCLELHILVFMDFLVLLEFSLCETKPP